MRDIKQALQEHKDCVLAHGYAETQLLGIFIYGSQNYGTATPHSDVDTKAVLIPSLENLAIHPIKTKELHLANDEHCEVMDIMHLVSNFRKQNINFVEVLYTNYCWINPIYKDLWDYYFIEYREMISHYDVNKCLQSICGQAIHTLRQNPFDGKKIGNGLRLFHFLRNYLAGEDYINCITLSENVKREVLEMKYKTLPTDEKSLELQKQFEYFKSLIANAPEVNVAAVDARMNEGIMELIRRYENLRRN